MDPSDCFSYLSLVLSIRFNILALSAFLFFLSAAVSHCSLYLSAIRCPLWLTDLLNLLKVFSIGSSSLQISLTAMFSFVAVDHHFGPRQIFRNGLVDRRWIEDIPKSLRAHEFT